MNSQPPASNTARIRQLNDQFRTTLTGGRLVITTRVAALPADTRATILAAVVGYSDFNSDNDPYSEHDFGALTVEGQKIFWKIDYLDRDLQFGSPDPANPSVTMRVLTIMLAKEY